jgi:hypothetical protein
MAELGAWRYALIYGLLSKIAECEGGTIETLETREGGIIISLKPAIPPSYWCAECIARAKRKEKWMLRWLKPIANSQQRGK